MNFSDISQRAVIALSCSVTTFCLSEITYFVQLLRHWATCKRPGGNPLDDPFCMSVISCRISTPSKIYLCFMNCKSNIYSLWGKKKDIEVYKVENGSILPSPHLFAVFMWHIGPLLLLMYLISLYLWEIPKLFPVVCSTVSVLLHPCALLCHSAW